MPRWNICRHSIDRGSYLCNNPLIGIKRMGSGPMPHARLPPHHMGSGYRRLRIWTRSLLPGPVGKDLPLVTASAHPGGPARDHREVKRRFRRKPDSHPPQIASKFPSPARMCRVDSGIAAGSLPGSLHSPRVSTEPAVVGCRQHTTGAPPHDAGAEDRATPTRRSHQADTASWLILQQFFHQFRAHHAGVRGNRK